MKKIFNLIDVNIFRPCFPKKKPRNFDGNNISAITISREMGAGGHSIAELIVKKLGKGWKLYHKEIIEKMAKTTKFKKELLEEVDEKKRSTSEKMVYDLFGRQYVTLPVYYKHLLEVVVTIGRRGKAVIVGRGANFILPGALNVRIICDMDQRIKWEMEFEKISKKEAVKRITESDKARASFIKKLFNHDIKKAHHYDLIIRTSKNLSIYDATDMIIRLAKKRFKI